MSRVLCLLCLLTLELVSARSGHCDVGESRLTEEQLRWAAGRTIRVGSDPAFAPFSQLDANGGLIGVDQQLLDAIASHTGLKFQTIPYSSWAEAWDGLIAGEVDMLTGVAQTPGRLEKVLFTQPYAHPRLAIVAHQQSDHGWSAKDLDGLTLAIPRSYAHLEDIRERMPKARVATSSNFEEALTLVATRQADATIINLASVVSLLPQADYEQLRVTGFYDREFPLRLAVRPGLPELVPVLESALSALRKQSAGAAYADWVDDRLNEWSGQKRQLRRLRGWLIALAVTAAALAAVLVAAWWRTRRPTPGGTAPAPTPSSPPSSGLATAFQSSRMPMLVVEPPDLILDRNATARALFNGAMVLPPELAAAAARLSALPSESLEIVVWAPPGAVPTPWQARLLPMPDGRCLLTLTATAGLSTGDDL